MRSYWNTAFVYVFAELFGAVVAAALVLPLYGFGQFGSLFDTRVFKTFGLAVPRHLAQVTRLLQRHLRWSQQIHALMHALNGPDWEIECMLSNSRAVSALERPILRCQIQVDHLWRTHPAWCLRSHQSHPSSSVMT